MTITLKYIQIISFSLCFIIAIILTILNRHKIKFIFAWYDIWIGIFYDKKKRWIYFFPIPFFGFVYKIMPEGYSLRLVVNSENDAKYYEVTEEKNHYFKRYYHLSEGWTKLQVAEDAWIRYIENNK